MCNSEQPIDDIAAIRRQSTGAMLDAYELAYERAKQIAAKDIPKNEDDSGYDKERKEHSRKERTEYHLLNILTLIR